MSLRINLGAGGNILPGWINTDIAYSDPNLRVDITKPLPWPDGSATNILCEHCLEHVSGPAALRCLDECYRILKPGSVLRVCVPSIDKLSQTGGQLELARDDILNHGHLIFFSKGSLTAMLRVAGFPLYGIDETDRRDCDGHWRVIGKERDDAETLRMEAFK